MAKQLKDVRGLAKAQRENERQQKRAEKLAKRREAREQRPEPESGQGTNPRTGAGAMTWACGRPRARHVRRSRGAGLVRGLVGQGRQGVSDYDTDILTWSERQAALLRRIAAGERINDEVDWPNVVEEIESVGRSDLNAVESMLIQAFVHDLKAEAWPLSPGLPALARRGAAVPATGEATLHRSMRQRIDVAGLYADALAGLPDKMEDQEPLPVPPVCPVTLDELLTGD